MLKKMMTALCVCLLVCFSSLLADASEVLKEKEPNDFIEDAVRIKGSLYEGTIGGEDVLDIYSFSATDRMNVILAMASESKSAFLALYNSYGDYVTESQPVASEKGIYTELLMDELYDGKYYAVVWDESKDTHAYAINIELLCYHMYEEEPVLVKKPTLTKEGEQKQYCWKCRKDVIEKIPCMKITDQPKKTFTTMGKSSRVTVGATGDGLTYQWYVKNAGEKKYSKSKTNTAVYYFTMSESSKDRMVYCIVKDKYGNELKSDTVYLRMAATVTEQPKNAKALIGTSAKTTVKAVGDGLTYTWYIKNPGAKKFSKSSATTKTYATKMTAQNSGRQVYCVVKDKYGKTAQTDTVTLTAVEPVKITKQPTTAIVKSGATAKVTVKAAGEGLTYTWYTKDKGTSKYVKSSVTKATYSVTMTNARRDKLLYCVVKDKYGNKVQTKTVVLRMAASITTQPKSVTAAKGKTAKVTVKAAGDGLTYTWYVKNAGATKFSKSSVTKPTYSVTMSSKLNGRQVYCLVKDKYGKTVKTNTATLKMQ